MIEIANVSFSYSEEPLLEQIDLTLQAGDFMVLFGADDAGKTTLLQLLLGFLPRYGGTALLFGKAAGELTAEERAWVRFVPDDITWDNMVASDYFALWQSASPEYDQPLQERLCEEFHVVPGSRFLEMTYGENKAAQLIAAICARPKLLILDEPGNFLEDVDYRKFLRVLKAQNDKGMSILLVTEKYAEAGGFSSHYAYLKDGIIKKCAVVPDPDYRWKVVSSEGGDQECFAKYMNAHERKNGRDICLYMSDMTKLPLVLQRAGSRDFIVEETTLEEEIDRDFTRWETKT